MQYESSVSLGYLNQSFQNAVMEGIRYGCEQGLYGWNVTDCKSVLSTVYTIALLVLQQIFGCLLLLYWNKS